MTASLQVYGPSSCHSLVIGGLVVAVVVVDGLFVYIMFYPIFCTIIDHVRW